VHFKPRRVFLTRILKKKKKSPHFFKEKVKLKYKKFLKKVQLRYESKMARNKLPRKGNALFQTIKLVKFIFDKIQSTSI
jgi:hypothetical protein